MSINVRKLRGLIVEKGFTLSSLSRTIGYSFASLSHIVNQHFKPKYDLICLIIKALEMTDEQIIEIFFKR